MQNDHHAVIWQASIYRRTIIYFFIKLLWITGKASSPLVMGEWSLILTHLSRPIGCLAFSLTLLLTKELVLQLLQTLDLYYLWYRGKGLIREYFLRLYFNHLIEVICSKVLSETIPSPVSSVYIHIMHSSIYSLLIYLVSLLETMNHSVDFATVKIGYSDSPILRTAYQMTSII